MFLRTVTKILFRTCKVKHLGLRKRRERITKAEAMVVYERGESMNVNERESKSREENKPKIEKRNDDAKTVRKRTFWRIVLISIRNSESEGS